MTGAPIYYDHANAIASSYTPSTIHVEDTRLSAFFRRYLLQKVMSVWKWETPEHWDQNYMLYSLYTLGFFAVINTDKYGVIPQHGTLGGYTVQYTPRYCVIANPLLRGINRPIIGEQCALIHLQPDYGSIMDVVNFYADLLALCAAGVSTNILNSKLSYVFTAGSKSAAETFKKMADRVSSGEPAVVFDKSLLNEDGTPAWQAFNQNLSQTYISDKLLSDMRKIEAMFDTEIGIPNANTDKRERLVTDEVNANNVETASRISMWLDEVKKGCEEASKMFGIKLSCDWRFDPYMVDDGTDEEVSDNESDT